MDVVSVAANAGAMDACTAAAACDFTPGVETSLGVILSDNDVASVRMYGGPVGQPCQGGQTIRMPTGFIDFEADGSESPYDCSWRIVCPAGKQVNLLMTGLDTETQQDVLSIWDGDVRMEQLLSELHGSNLPPGLNFISSGESIDMTFRSDGYTPESALVSASFKCGYPCCATAAGGYCSFLGEGWVECNDACARCDMWDNADARQSGTEGGTRFDTYAIELNSPPQGDIVVVPASAQVSVEPAFGVFTPANWSESMVFTIIANDDPVAELGENPLPACDVLDGACGAVGMLNFGVDCVPVGVAEPDATAGRGPHRGVIRHTIVGDDFVYSNMPLEWLVYVDITDNDSPAVSIRKNLAAMPQSHQAEIIANDYYELRLDGWIARETSYTGALNGSQNPWPESNYHTVTAA